MTPNEVKSARNQLGLSVNDLARLLDTDGQSIRRMEYDVEMSTHRKPAPRMVRLVTAYLKGYRPDDWPS